MSKPVAPATWPFLQLVTSKRNIFKVVACDEFTQATSPVQTLRYTAGACMDERVCVWL
jgi:hypothetical protein